MTEAVQQVEEKEANPYNMKKDWHAGKEENFENANGLFFQSEPVVEKATSSEAEAPKETKGKDVNYKKRYDDLKKHYDNKVSEFKQREQELVALKQRETDIAKKEAEVELRQKHPDFENIRGDEKFHEWAKLQPEEIQNWVYNNPNNASLASKAIDLFKLENGGTARSTKTQSASKGSAADMVSTKTKSIDTKQPKIWTEREIAQMSVTEFDKYQDDINQAISEGRVTK